MLLERALKILKDLCLSDYIETFDNVQHKEILEIQGKPDLYGNDIEIIPNFYWEQNACIQIVNRFRK